MTRALALLLGGLLVAGAGSRTHLPVPPPLKLPLPPPLPAHPPTDLDAPMPDGNLSAPSGLARSSVTEWALRVYRMQALSTGEGFIPGSAYQSPEQRRPMQTPGFMVTVPLQ